VVAAVAPAVSPVLRGHSIARFFSGFIPAGDCGKHPLQEGAYLIQGLDLNVSGLVDTGTLCLKTVRKDAAVFYFGGRTKFFTMALFSLPACGTGQGRRPSREPKRLIPVNAKAMPAAKIP
jgi:hypothetical protein